MNILHLSDTHGAHRSLGRLPEADVIVHSGDITIKEDKYNIQNCFAYLEKTYLKKIEEILDL